MTCQGYYVELDDGITYFICHLCRDWCEGPCDGIEEEGDNESPAPARADPKRANPNAPER